MYWRLAFPVISRILVPITGFVIVCAIWQLGTFFIVASNSSLSAFWPGVAQITDALWHLVISTDFWRALVITNCRVLMALLSSMVIAIVLAFLLFQYEFIDALFGSVADLLRYVPVAAIIPITIILFGVDDLQRISVLVFGTVFYGTVLVTVGFRRVPLEYRELGLVAGFSPYMLFRMVIWPAALPDVLQATRISAGICWSYVLVAEIVASDTGLGFLIIRAQRFLRADMLFALVILTGLVGLAYDRIIVGATRIVCPWAQVTK
jgi:NitT/TauT family transport system permease protein